MSERNEAQVISATTPRVCQFPTGPDSVCGVQIVKSEQLRGAPRQYCDHPAHTAQKALRLKRKLAEQAARHDPQPEIARPIAGGIVTLSALVERIEQLQGELAAVVTDVGAVVSLVADPDALTREIAAIERDAALKIAAVERAKAGVEKTADVMSRRLGEMSELERLALAAADESAAAAEEAKAAAETAMAAAARDTAATRADLDRVRLECDQEVRQHREMCELALAAQARAEAERDSATAKADGDAEEITKLRQHLADLEAQHRQQLEVRDIEYARAITAAHAMADRAAREQREQVNQLLRTQLAGGAQRLDHAGT